MNNWLFGPPARQDAPSADGPAPEIECPGVGIRAGASTLSVSQPGVEAGPLTTRYQATIGEMARECAALGSVMTMRVGVQGRVLLGPAGGPGQLDVPIRIAVVQEGPEPKTIVSKFTRLPVPIPPGQASVPFSYVEQDLTFPMPRADVLEAYVVYVGFDPQGMTEKPQKKKKK